MTTYSSQSCAENALELIVRTTSLISSDPCLIKWNSPDPWCCQLGQRNAESSTPRGDLLKRHNHGLVSGLRYWFSRGLNMLRAILHVKSQQCS